MDHETINTLLIIVVGVVSAFHSGEKELIATLRARIEVLEEYVEDLKEKIKWLEVELYEAGNKRRERGAAVRPTEAVPAEAEDRGD